MPKISLNKQEEKTVPQDNKYALTVPKSLMTTAIDVVREESSRLPYVTFIYPTSKKWGELSVVIRGMKQEDVILVDPDISDSVKLDPFRFSVVNAVQYWADISNDGTMLAASMTNPGRAAKNLKEVVDTVLIVYLADNAELVKCTFKGPKTPAAHVAIESMNQAASNDWGGLSRDHQASLVMPYAPARTITTCTLQPSTSRSTGNKYALSVGVSKPSGPSEWAMISELFKTEDFDGLFNDLTESIMQRKAEAERLSSK